MAVLEPELVITFIIFDNGVQAICCQFAVNGQPRWIRQ